MGYTEGVAHTQKVVVIGAGLSGLTCAYRLRQLGLTPLVLEATDRPGGVISSVRRNGFLFETGPQFPRFPAPVWQLVRELRLETEFLAGNPKANRYILHDGRLHAAPFSPAGFATTHLVSLKSKLRVLAEPFARTQPPDHEENLAEFVERKFGSEILDALVDPFISTIFFGDARKMGMQSAFPALVDWERHHGSLVRGALRARKAKRDRSNSNSLRVTDSLPTLGSFKSGMATLTEKLAAALPDAIRYKTEITSITPAAANAGGSSPSLWQIHLSSGDPITAEHLILAIPSYTAAPLLQNTVPQLAAQLAAIEYAPISVISSAYNRAHVAHNLDGFGFMVPRREGLNTICTFWNSSLFPGRAPQSSVLLTSFAVRNSSHAPSATSDDTWAQIVEAENAKILGITAPPLDRVVWQAPHALPQYNVGHARRVAEISAILSASPTLHVIGNFLHGRSIGDCVELAERVAREVDSQLAGSHI